MKRLCLILAAVVLLVGGCGGPDPKSAPVIKWQEDVCDFCHMGIEDRRFAAGYRLTSGEQRIFDDIGDMLLFLAKEQGAVASVWLRDYEQDRWLPAETAFLVEGRGIESPMGYGLAAVGSKERAGALARDAVGTVFTWEELKARGVSLPRGQ